MTPDRSSELPMTRRWFRRLIGRVAKGQLSLFRQEVEGKRFPNPETGNEVLFDSLPQKEQARYFAEWRRKQQGAEPKPEKVRGLVEIDREDARTRAQRLAERLSSARVHDPDERIGDRFVVGGTYGVITVTDVRGRVFQRPLKIGMGKPTPGLWRAGRHFVTGGSVKVRHHREKDPGMPTEVRIDLNPEVTYGDLAKGRDRLEREIYSVLIHEMTHARDVLESPKQQKKLKQKHKPPQDADVSTRSRAENVAYYNRPSEVRAFKRQVAEEFEQALRRKNKDEEDANWIEVTAEAILRVLEQSPTWNRVRHFLTPESRRKYFETIASVARRFKEERGGKVASYPQEFLDTVESQRYRNPQTDHRVKFVSLPIEDQTRIYERWKQRRNTQRTSPPADPKLEETGEKTWQGGNIYRADVTNDTFVHFTPRSRAKQILDSGKLLANPPYKKMGISGVQAISLGYGSHSPEVQTKHIKNDPEDPMVAVVFQTPTGPKHGYSEEVVWDGDVDLHQAQILDADEAKKLIDVAPKQITEDDMVIYGPKKSAKRVQATLTRRAVSFEEWVRGQRFPSPKTRRRILFKSLPLEEQERIRAKWHARVEQEESSQAQSPTKKVKDPLYHTTSHVRLEAIAEHGLSPRSGEGTFSHGGYAEHSQGKVFLSDSPKAARAWHSKVYDQLEDKHGDDEEVSNRVPVMLRVKARKTRRDEVGDTDIPGSRYTNEGVPPEDIEFWHPKKKRWEPVSEWGKDTSADHAVSSRDENGIYLNDEAFMPEDEEVYDRDDSEEVKRDRETQEQERERSQKERLEREQREMAERERQYLEPAARREWINRIKEHGAKSPIPGQSTAPGVFPKMWQTRLKVDEKGEPLPEYPLKEARVAFAWLDSLVKSSRSAKG